MSRAAGIDVGGERKGCDLVVLEERRVIDHHRGLAPGAIPEVLSEHAPDIVCIDGPPTYAAEGTTRAAERELMRRGIRLFVTPCESKAQIPWYDWMRVGFACFDVVASTYPRYRSGNYAGHTHEVFPHAAAVVLDGALPEPGTAKATRRRAVLERHGVDTSRLATIDAIDAALCALTGVIALQGGASAVGDADDGLIILPTRVLQDRYVVSA